MMDDRVFADGPCSHFILCLREQLKKSKVKVIEVFPPAVQTELHDEKHQPDIQNGGSIGMPLDEFMDEVGPVFSSQDAMNSLLF
jgi:short-subunit dehydrogenase involved in D-alanine esterification of teichoic acids